MPNPILKQALVVGAGVGGLAAAKAIAPHFEKVIVFDRGALPDAPAPRHTHRLLAGGCRRDAASRARRFDDGASGAMTCNAFGVKAARISRQSDDRSEIAARSLVRTIPMNGIEKQAAFYRGYLPDDRSLVPLTIVLATVCRGLAHRLCRRRRGRGRFPHVRVCSLYHQLSP
jgi:hypothetical protein